MQLTTTAVPVAGSPEKTLARFEAMIAERPLKAAVTHVVLPAVTTTTTSSPLKPVKALKSPAPGVKDTVDADRRILLQPLFGPYPRDHVLEVCRIFVRIDVDNSGVIETSEFVEKLSQLEGDDWRDALFTVFRDLDQDHNGLRKFRADKRRLYVKHPERSIADRWRLAGIIKIFQQYDANANASLELDEFIELLRDIF
ncbi:hypothetical protein SPRG_14199 [Saprolegnia parasitica CBS 223.65]|uniref:EF-hand domain-containing protein n=1 Tax=Saprolegnia parasitica (strain CBS 223.65) TaxID=695850 RepID=A0A067C0F9_SAPPC|nr:hypothetical protein SPRG_14199 [Saprolegnia parasitica CBS 223.65]KDO20051.1 hypothetical protein SPRG_14199 [Saprolegnia parasitica CBS 223.65]|eukprot:XP_012209214.1 hypothetical protein SPRG_14199 [Saprolegnia parasitica CBS 223.65]